MAVSNPSVGQSKHVNCSDLCVYVFKWLQHVLLELVYVSIYLENLWNQFRFAKMPGGLYAIGRASRRRDKPWLCFCRIISFHPGSGRRWGILHKVCCLWITAIAQQHMVPFSVVNNCARGSLPAFAVCLRKVRYEPPSWSIVFPSRSVLGGSEWKLWIVCCLVRFLLLSILKVWS